MSLILASGSPRRRELIALVTRDFIIRPSTVDESRLRAVVNLYKLASKRFLTVYK